MSNLECEAARFLREVNDAGKKGFNAWAGDLKMEFMQNLMQRYRAYAQPIISTHGVTGERIMFTDGSALTQRYKQMGTFHLSLPGDAFKEYFA